MEGPQGSFPPICPVAVGFTFRKYSRLPPQTNMSSFYLLPPHKWGKNQPELYGRP